MTNPICPDCGSIMESMGEMRPDGPFSGPVFVCGPHPSCEAVHRRVEHLEAALRDLAELGHEHEADHMRPLGKAVCRIAHRALEGSAA
jgi:hypothetical protein